MKHIFYRIIDMLLILSLCAGLLSALGACGTQPSPQDAMHLFAARYPLPAGRIYISDAAEFEEGYLAPARFDLLYARSDGGSDLEDIQSYALFFGTSSRLVSEMGIFLCPDRDAALEVAGMLRGRITRILMMKEADFSCAADARIELYGSVVVYTVLPDNSAAVRTLARILS